MGSRLQEPPRNTPVPQEAVYHVEHFAVLHAWLPTEVLLIPEFHVLADSELATEPESAESKLTKSTAKSSAQIRKSEANYKRSQACDLTMVYLNKKYVIEYGATLNMQGIQKHFWQAANYAKAQGAEEALFVHFTLADTDTPNVFTFPETDTVDGVKLRAIHIVHNEDFTDVKVCMKQNVYK